jgi:phosphoenolpyruvate-protein kinase (PTS system EI component)
MKISRIDYDGAISLLVKTGLNRFSGSGPHVRQVKYNIVNIHKKLSAEIVALVEC